MQKNRIELAGYLTARPELRYLPSGTKVANVRMGETYRFGGKDGLQLSHTNWHSLTFYEDIADAALSCEKGDNLFVEGSLQQRQFTPADGVKRTIQEVVVRSFHIIAPARVHSSSTHDGNNPAGNETAAAHGTLSQGGVIDADWPVGPA